MRVLDRRAIWPTLILIMGALSWCADRSGPNQDGSKLREAQQLLSEIPLYDGFKEVDRSEISRGTSVLVSRYYDSDASADDVIAFYSEWLNKHEWIPVRKKKLNDWGRDLMRARTGFSQRRFHL